MRKVARLTKNYIIIILFPLIFNAGTVTASEGIDGSDSKAGNVILDAMKKELIRSMNELQMDEYDKPYFISYSIYETERLDIGGQLGAIIYSGQDKDRSAVVDVRVGDYELDNTDVNTGGFDYGSAGRFGRISSRIPIEDDETAIRSILWYLTDLQYKSALENYLKKRGRRVFEVIQDTIPDFSRENYYKHHDTRLRAEIDLEKWKSIVRELSKTVGINNFVLESSVRFSNNRETMYFINSEGSEIVTENTYYTLSISASTKAPDGQQIENYRNFYGRKIEDIPGRDSLRASALLMLKELAQLREAEELEPYAGPALLDAQAVGVIFHEAIGHRLEGERQRMKDSQQTFKEKIGQKIIPEFLSLYDDPTLADWNGHSLFGHYAFDNEGIRAQRVALIEHGILKNFLMSRTPNKEFSKSNGHGRRDGSSYSAGPMGRMGVTLLKAENEVPYSDLKKLLLDECRKQGKKYGLIVRQVRGGETSTHSWGYQAFKETPVLMFRVDVDTGIEKLVRGVEIVGTPLTSINKIIAASETYGVFNGFCGAESGYIPVSIIAPAVVTQELELQKLSEEKSKPPLLKPPFLDIN